VVRLGRLASPDPEIPVLSVLDLGIVREVSTDAVLITPTYTGCPATQVIEHDISRRARRRRLSRRWLETTLSPPWTTDWISAEGRGEAARLWDRAAAACRRARG
jgi:ring-1,2-phenylacetyl-CoA epoxidase subunit PaaD